LSPNKAFGVRQHQRLLLGAQKRLDCAHLLCQRVDLLLQFWLAAGSTNVLLVDCQIAEIVFTSSFLQVSEQLVVHLAFFIGEFFRLGLKIGLMHLLRVQDTPVLLLPLLPLDKLFSFNCLALLAVTMNCGLFPLKTQLFDSLLLLVLVDNVFH